MEEHYRILLRPVITEKSTILKEENNQLVLKVARDANKIQIKNAVEKVFRVKVLEVKTMNYAGKRRRRRTRVAKLPSWKKAVVRLKHGNRVEFFEGV